MLFYQALRICPQCRVSIYRSLRNDAKRAISSRAGLRDYTSDTAPSSRPFRVAVVGSGPAGFYAAYRLMGKVSNAFVDMYEQLPVPFGLVRYGVAPDHPEVKVSLEFWV